LSFFAITSQPPTFFTGPDDIIKKYVDLHSCSVIPKEVQTQKFQDFLKSNSKLRNFLLL